MTIPEIYLTEKVQKQIKEWIAALRSGRYVQGRSVLQNKDGYCCLGVGCDLFLPLEGRQVSSSGLINGDYPEYHGDACPLWLQSIDIDTYNMIKVRLSSLNDEENFTFLEIADVIEAIYINKNYTYWADYRKEK